MLTILAVEPGSIAEELGLEAGDLLLAINGAPVRDLLDYQLRASDEELLLEIQKRDGEVWELELEKDAFEPLGVDLPHPEPTQCGNDCIFCFVHQLPSGMRSSLYVKDEDYRFSFLYGSYVTLTNIGEAEVERILEQRLSPLYVSIHATDEELRTRLIGRQGLPILPLLRRLTAGGIQIHTQIVVCPGYNDGLALEKTIEDLAALFPGIASLAVVPVGLTGYRRRLPDLRPPSADEARTVLTLLKRFQELLLARSGTRFVFAADEFFLLGGIEFPPLETYEDLSQLENGVGLIPLFRAEAEEALKEAKALALPDVSLLTGESAYPELETFTRALAARTGTTIYLYPVHNEFFGGHVTVTGLLVGKDIVRQLRNQPLGRALLIPDVVLREGDEVLLDDLSLADLERELGVPVRPVASTPWGLLEGLEALADELL